MPYVFVVGIDGVVSKKFIEVGIENENYSEIITNLDKSLRIVSTWNNDLAEGTTVNVVKDEKVEDEIVFETTINNVIDDKEIETKNVASVSEISETTQSESKINEEREIIEESKINEESESIAANKLNETEEQTNNNKGSFIEESTTISPFSDRAIDSNSVKITEVK